MIKHKITLKPTIVWLGLILGIAFMLPAPALAGGINLDNTVEKGEVLDQNVILSGPAVSMQGTINGDLLAMGDEITIDGKVDGSLVTAGKKVTLNGPVSGSVVIAAPTLVLGPQASIGRDVYFVGGGLKAQDGSTINRDLNSISLEADLSGSVKRKVNSLVGPLNLAQAIYSFMQNQGWLPRTQQLGSGSALSGFGWTAEQLAAQQDVKLVAQPAVRAMGFGLPVLQHLVRFSPAPAGRPALTAGRNFQATQPGGTIDVERLKGWLIPFLRNLAALLILGLLGIWLVPAQLNWAGDLTRQSPWRAFLTGLMVFVLGWILALLAFALILALAFFLYWLSLPTLGFLSGTLGLTTLGLAVTVFWLCIAYFSKLIIAILAGRLIFRRFIPKQAQSRVWPLVTGVFLYALLASIPYLGWVVMVLATLFGLGALWMVASPRGLPAGKPVDLLQPAGDSPGMGLVTDE